MSKRIKAAKEPAMPSQLIPVPDVVPRKPAPLNLSHDEKWTKQPRQVWTTCAYRDHHAMRPDSTSCSVEEAWLWNSCIYSRRPDDANRGMNCGGRRIDGQPLYASESDARLANFHEVREWAMARVAICWDAYARAGATP